MINSFNNYLVEAKKHLISAEEEMRLAKIYKSKEEGWEGAGEKIIKANLLFVVKTAFEYTTDSSRVQDLVAEGNLSLVQSLDNYDPSRGVKFLTFACFSLRGKMIKQIIDNGEFSTFKVPTKSSDKAHKIKQLIQERLGESRGKPSILEIQDKFKLTRDQAAVLLDLAERKTLSIDYKHSNEEGDSPVNIQDESIKMPYEEADAKEVSNIVNQIISKLPLRNQAVINRRFGLNGHELSDLATIGKEFNITKERVRQIENSILILLRNEFSKLNIKQTNY